MLTTGALFGVAQAVTKRIVIRIAIPSTRTDTDSGQVRKSLRIDVILFEQEAPQCVTAEEEETPDPETKLIELLILQRLDFNWPLKNGKAISPFLINICVL
jgi:hypothetical protein